jgi:hypothetical protein
MVSTFWRAISVLGVALVVMARPAAGQGHFESKLWSFDVTPQVGYRTTMSFTAEPGIDGATPRLVVDSNPSYGVAFGVRYNDEDVIEFRWARQETRLHIQGGAVAPLRHSVILDQYHFDFSHEYVVREWPAWARPFVIGSVGVTRVSGTVTTASFTRFSFGLGGGVKAFPNGRFGLKIQAQWLPLWVDPEITAFCGFGCVIHLSGPLASQGEITFGPVLRF